MNPYDFVHLDWNRPGHRRPSNLHHRFNGLNGRIEATLTTETPFFLPAKQTNSIPLIEMSGATLFSQSIAYQSANNPRGYFIAGSSLKGLFRSVTETVTHGCFLLFDGKYKSKKLGNEVISDYSDNLPGAFKRCHNVNELCAACRMFGMMERNGLRLGNVSFGDAVCTLPQPHNSIFTLVLDTPKPRHQEWYLETNPVTNRMHIAGRKYYFHTTALSTETELKRSRNGTHLNAHIRPLGTGSTFTFTVEFANVDDDDFAALLYAMTLEQGEDEGSEMRHKFGYAKPCGLGSVHIQITRLILSDPVARYSHGGGDTAYENAELTAEINHRIIPFAATIPVTTRADLRYIWQWPPRIGVNYRYPTQTQFSSHPTDPISATDTW